MPTAQLVVYTSDYFFFFLTAHTTNGAELLIVNRGCYILKGF